MAPSCMLRSLCFSIPCASPHLQVGTLGSAYTIASYDIAGEIPASFKPKVVVLDEAHAIKSHKAARTVAAKHLMKVGRSRFAARVQEPL